MDNFASILQQIPPGVDIYDFLSKTVEDQAYPELGRAFWVQAYVAVGLCSLVILAISGSLYVRWRAKRLNFLISDGPLSRPDPRTVVPILWLIMSGSLIVVTFWFRSALSSRRMTYGFGVYWLMITCPLMCSYAVISTSMMCTAPGIRKVLMRLNNSHSARRTSPALIIVNGILLFLCILAICSSYPPGRLYGKAFVALTQGYNGLQESIARARAEQDLMILTTVTEYVDRLAAGQNYVRRAILITGIIYSTFIVFFFFTGLLPAVFLNIYLRKRIESLDKGLYASTWHHANSVHYPDFDNMPPTYKDDDPNQDVEIIADTFLARISLKAPIQKDSPFMNLTPTSMLPHAYASIFKAKVEPQEKAKRIKAALRRDNLRLGAYCLMLASMGSLALFQAAKGPYRFQLRNQYIQAYAWEMWSYLAPAILLAGATLYDALNGMNGEDDVAEVQLSSFGSRSFAAPPLSSIQLSQTIEVVEEQGQELKETISVFCIDNSQLCKKG